MEYDLSFIFRDVFVAWFFVFLRVSSFLFLVPGIGEQTVTTRIKIMLGAAVAVAVFPAVQQYYPASAFLKILASEIFAGVALGLTLRLLILALQTAGSIAGQSTSLAQLFGSNAGEPLPAIGNILVISALALFMIAGLHVKAVQFIVLSYEILPPGQFPRPSAFSEWGAKRVGYAFELAFILATPFIILSAIYNLALGAINRAMPQLMVAFVGAPLITAGGLILLLISAPVILTAWVEAVSGFLGNPMNGLD